MITSTLIKALNLAVETTMKPTVEMTNWFENLTLFKSD